MREKKIQHLITIKGELEGEYTKIVKDYVPFKSRPP